MYFLGMGWTAGGLRTERMDGMTRWITLTVMASLVLAGCQTGPFAPKSSEPEDEALMEEVTAPSAYEGPPMTDPGLAIATEQRFSDIPLPVGLKEDLERTFVYESSQLAVGRMVYSTKSSVNELAQFYIDECPAADWQLLDIVQAGGADLTFRKPGKRLGVGIRDLGVARGRMLTLTLTPEAE